MKSHKIKVQQSMNTIVLGKNHNNTLGLIWSLHEGGHNVTLLLYDSDCNYVGKSKFVDKTYLLKVEDDVISLLKKVAKGMTSKPVVFVSGDEEATLLNEHFEDLSSFCFFEGGRSDGSINKYRDKDEGELLAKKCGFTIPQTVLIASSKELDDVTIGYPLLIKANNSVHGGKSAMKKCDTYEVADSFVNSLPEDYFPLQVQEFIEKEYELMLLGCSLYGGKRVICPVANKKIRQYPPNIGVGAWSVAAEVAASVELRLLADKVSDYLKEIKYTGNFSAEFLYSGGKYYFLEINLRNDGTSWLSTCSGYNLPDMVCRSFEDENVSSEGCVFCQRHYMNILWDIHCLRKGGVGFRQWLKQFNSKTCYSHYYHKDKKTFYYFIKGLLLPILKRRINIFN